MFIELNSVWTYFNDNSEKQMHGFRLKGAIVNYDLPETILMADYTQLGL